MIPAAIYDPVTQAPVKAGPAPVVSVLLPVYNAERFLPATLDSLLGQTFTDFEVIAVNDGSTDGSAAILQRYAARDARIRYIANDGNKGLIYTLNVCIDAARGQYFARMDADDICMPERFAVQLQWLQQHPEVSLVATWSDFIDEEGRVGGYWELDRKATSIKAIRRMMPKECCLSHPTVMAPAEVFREFRYTPTLKTNEDYDLWLRLLNAGRAIGKIDRVLLQYRMLQTSITRSEQRTQNIFMKQVRCKYPFLLREMKQGRYTWFECRVAFFLLRDLVMALAKAVKKRVKHALRTHHT